MASLEREAVRWSARFARRWPSKRASPPAGRIRRKPSPSRPRCSPTATASPARVVTRVYRDSEGRTRREQLNDSGVVESVSIVDPVAHTSVVLQPGTRTAYRQQDVMRFTG